MRQSRLRCQSCQTEIEPSWQFCLSCGEPVDASLPTPEEVEETRKREAKAYQSGKVRCWQCKTKLREPSPACPGCGADLLNPRSAPVKQVKNADGTMTHLSPVMLGSMLLAALVLIGGFGAVMYRNGDRSSAHEKNHLSLPHISLPSFLGGDDEQALVLPDGVQGDATAATVVSIADDGLIVVKVGSKQLNLRLAGIQTNFAGDCGGDKGLARLRRIAPDGSSVYLAADSAAGIVLHGTAKPQMVYLWAVDSSGKLRFANQEILAAGEGAITALTLEETSLAADLTAASERAVANKRGRYADGACS